MRRHIPTLSLLAVCALMGYLLSEVIFFKSFSLRSLLVQAQESVGLTIYILLPLALWALLLTISGKATEYTLSYIGVTSQRIGLLGTVAGIVEATVAINLSGDVAQSVKMALPAVGQALVSTGAGFLVALFCDFMIFATTNPQGEQHEVPAEQ